MLIFDIRSQFFLILIFLRKWRLSDIQTRIYLIFRGTKSEENNRKQF